MSESDGGLKVTDKRMFTADGELREEFRDLESQAAATEPAPSGGTVPEREPAPKPETGGAPVSGPASEPPSEPASASPPSQDAPTGGDPGVPGFPESASFLDLLGMLAEPIALFLGDARLPDGKSAENLQAARFHIDLLNVIQQKTSGNLTAEESALLEDLLYRLRLRYVQKTT